MPAASTLAAALLLALTACGSGGPTTPSATDALTGTVSSAHLEFHFSPQDAVDVPRQEAFHEWAVSELGVNPMQRLRYNKYRDRGHMERVTGQATNGWADPPAFTVHSIWPWDAHEAVHIYTSLIGRPSDFFNEGIAVALSVDPLDGRFVSLWNNQPIDDIARTLLRNGSLPSILGMAETDAFRRLPDQASYPAAGSFTSHLLQSHGVQAMRRFFELSARGDSQPVIQVRFASAFGVSLAEAESRWRAFLLQP